MNTKPEVVISAKNRETLRGRALVDFVEQELARGASQVWVEAVEAGDDQRLRALGLAPKRDLWQLRIKLPAELPEKYQPVKPRPFQAHDKKAFLKVNREAFAWHPEQGQLSSEQFDAIIAEDWYDPAGFLVLEIDGQMAGFCWTKIHRHENPQLGEIYVIGVAPNFSGQGLGAPLTHAGLEFLSGSGLAVGMLYVEADNAPAQKIYRTLGFEPHQVNRVYQLA